MADHSRREVKPGAMNKAALETGQMDLTGFRMGKQRLVSKKKKKSSLKKAIVEERYERQGRAPPYGLGTTQAALTRPQKNFSTLSLDAPEFVPSAWALAAARAGEGGSGAEASAEPVPNDSAPPADRAPAATAATEGAAQPAARGKGRGPKVPKAPAPAFVPSWMQRVEEEPAQGNWTDEELPVAQAMEQLKLQEGQPTAERKPKLQQQRTVDYEVRDYVHQVLSDELDEKVKLMLGELARYQERAKELNPMKYAKQKRYCVGLRESARAVARNKAKCLIFAPNLEISTAEGGLDETVEDLIEVAREAEVPVIFALSRNRIGKALGKNVRFSIVTVLSAEGAHQQFKEALRLTDDLRRQWVLRQMSQMTSEDAEEARRRAAEKAERNAERRIAREQLRAERRAEEERRQAEAKAAKEAAKARRAEEQKAYVERRRAEKAVRQEEEAEREAQGGAERTAEEEHRLALLKAAEEEKERMRREAEERAEREKRRIEAELAAKEAAARAAAAGSDSDTDSDVDLPAGFNDSLF